MVKEGFSFNPTKRDVAMIGNKSHEKTPFVPRNDDEKLALSHASDFLKLLSGNATENVKSRISKVEEASDGNVMPETKKILTDIGMTCGMTKLLSEKSYLTGFGNFFLLSEYSVNIANNRFEKVKSDDERLGINLKEGKFGIFDISADLPEIESRLITENLHLVNDGNEDQKKFMFGWQAAYDEQYLIKAPQHQSQLKKDERPLIQKVREKAVNFFVQAYDANATRGHVINIVGGAVGMNRFLAAINQQDIVTRLGPAIGVVALAAFIGSFNLANRGMDQSVEKIPHKVLTFAPTIAMGMIAGTIAKTPEQALAMAPMILILAASGMAYWNISQMSRNFHFTMLQQAGVLGRYPNFADAMSRIKGRTEHAIADNILKLATTPRNYWQIVRTVRNEVAPKIDADERTIKGVLSDVRSYLKVPNNS